MRELRGVLGPVVTPFDGSGELDIAAFVGNVKSHVQAGLDGIVVAGSTGEGALLDEMERRRLTEAARDAVPEGRWLIAGTGAESTRLCISRCRDAAAAGADAVLVVSPHYFTSMMTSAALAAHFARVADESPVPLLLYNIPKYAHFRLEPELVARLSTHPNIAGMKDSSGDMDGFPRYVEFQGDAFTVLTGHGGSFATALRLGARGGILAVALFAAELSVDVWRLHNEGRYSEAGAVQSKLVPLAAEIVARMGVAGVKAAMDAIGMNGGPVRSPLLPVSPEDAGRVRALLRDAGALAEATA